jgi:hypothetical protein
MSSILRQRTSGSADSVNSRLVRAVSLTAELLRLPAHAVYLFPQFFFHTALCQATNIHGGARRSPSSSLANAYFLLFAGGDGLSNTTVTSICQCDERISKLLNALAAALPSNSTLQDVTFGFWGSPTTNVWVNWSPGTGKNTGLKTLIVDAPCLMDESLCPQR